MRKEVGKQDLARIKHLCPSHIRQIVISNGGRQKPSLTMVTFVFFCVTLVRFYLPQTARRLYCMLVVS